MTLVDAAGRTERFGVTADHPWLVEHAAGQEWVQTLDLKPGDQLVTEDADRLTFKSATLREGLAQTYNLEVDDTHTFLVGEDGVVVHNAFNCFKAKTVQQIVDMFTRKGFVPKGPNPAAGQGQFVNPGTGRGYHIDLSHLPPKPPHVGVVRPREPGRNTG